jgi:hypothetical protein
VRARKRATHIGAAIASSASDHPNAASTGCSSGHGAPRGSAVGLPKSVRTAATIALIGLYSATSRRPSGRPAAGTNVLARNDAGSAVRKTVQVGGGAPDPEIEAKLDSLVRYLDTQLEGGAYPHLKAFAGDDARSAFGRMVRMASDDERFERGLQILLDGIALDVERRSL